MTALDFDQVVEQYHLTLAEFAKGDPEPVIGLLSRGGDASLAGGFGGFTHGWEQVAKNVRFAATQFKKGQIASRAWRSMRPRTWATL